MKERNWKIFYILIVIWTITALFLVGNSAWNESKESLKWKKENYIMLL